MADLIQWLVSIILIIGGGWFVWESAMIIDEKKQRQRLGLTDYYDNPIEENDKNSG